MFFLTNFFLPTCLSLSSVTHSSVDVTLSRTLINCWKIHHPIRHNIRIRRILHHLSRTKLFMLRYRYNVSKILEEQFLQYLLSSARHDAIYASSISKRFAIPVKSSSGIRRRLIEYVKSAYRERNIMKSRWEINETKTDEDDSLTTSPTLVLDVDVRCEMRSRPPSDMTNGDNKHNDS